MSVLVIYFSAGGRTAKIAKEFAGEIGADIFEITPTIPYSKADITWINPFARCNKEQCSKEDIPISGKIENFEKYDTVYMGFPIWYGGAPKVVYNFCKAYDWSKKTLYVFATSGGGGIGKTAEKLGAFTKGTSVTEAKLVKNLEGLMEWAKKFL